MMSHFKKVTGDDVIVLTEKKVQLSVCPFKHEIIFL